MKIFGLELGKKDAGQGILVRTVKPSTKPISKIPPVAIASISYAQQFSRGRGTFIAPEYDLSEIGKIEDTDGFVRQAFKKKEGLMFKEAIGVKGKNKDTVRYYTTRMSQIARASRIPTNELLKRIARSLIRTSNAYLIKVRDPKASGGKVRQTLTGKDIDPVAAYFPAAPETMRVDLDYTTGKVRGWRQLMPDGLYKDFKPEEVIHFVIDRREGFFFGIPLLVPVIDDIRALRQIEENIELLLYQHLFPLLHYKVGTETAPAGYTEDGSREIDLVREEISMMPSEGAIVTPERHEITMIGAEGRAIRAEAYLIHFKKRVFAGLGVSQIDMGDGDSTNRATANTLSRALVDRVKGIQADLECQWDQEVISELLLESTFGDDVLEEDNMVHLQFSEVDIDTKVQTEKHAIELFKANGLTYPEFREELRREPIPLPEDGEDQDITKYPEWHMTYWKLFDEPTQLIRAVDEPYSANAQAAAAARSSGITNKSLETAQQTKEKQAQSEAETKMQIEVKKAQITARNRPKDHYLGNSFAGLEQDLVSRLTKSLQTRNNLDRDYLLSLGKLWASEETNKLISFSMREFLRGFNDVTSGRSSEANSVIGLVRSEMYTRYNSFLNRLVEQTVDIALKRIDQKLGEINPSEMQSSILEQVHVSFDANRFRTDFIWDMELKKANNYGKLQGIKFIKGYGIRLEAHPNSCDRCKAVDGHVIKAYTANLDEVPPIHPNSRMLIKVLQVGPGYSQTRDKIKQKDTLDGTEIECPKCGGIAVYDKEDNVYTCEDCGYQFNTPDDPDGNIT